MLHAGVIAAGSAAFSRFEEWPADTSFINLEWQRQAGPVISPPGGTLAQHWDGASIYAPNVVRNLDRTVYRDGSGDMYMLYIGDNTSPGDLDQVGLFKGPSLETLVKVSEAAPLMPLGSSGQPDAGDVQVSSVWFDGAKFIIYYAGNASAPGSGLGDDVTLCKATTTDWVTITRYGRVLGKGPNGDSEDHYWHRLVPNAPGGPRMYYAGKNGSNVFGIMCATAPSIDGPWTRLSNSHLFQDNQPIIGDVWYEDGLYHFLYSPMDGARGVWYATSTDGVTIVKQREIYTLHPGEWDERIYHVSFIQDGGANYLLFNSHAHVGIGYAVGY